MDEEKNAFDVAQANGRLHLTVTIGEGQLGASTVFRGGTVLVKGGVVVANLDLGNAGDLHGTNVVVDSIVNDISSHTNRMSVTYVVTDSGKKQKFIARHKVENEGELCHFISTINFA
jgi:hypothetical protein